MTPRAMFQRLWNLNVAAVLLLIACAWPGLWWLWLASPRLHLRPAPMPGPTIRYLLAETGKDDGLWSPLLFSLPTPYGFSRTVQMEWLETRGVPIVALSRPPPMVLHPPHHPLPDATALPDLALQVRNSLSPYRPPAPPVSTPTATDPEKPIWISDAQLAAARFALPENWHNALPPVPRPWSITAVIEMQPNGAVAHVFLVAPHERSDLNAAIISQLRQSRGATDGKPWHGTVTVTLP